MARRMKFEKLVDTAWVNKLIHGGSLRSYKGNGYLIIEAVTGTPKNYLEGHIPGAISLDTNTFEREPSWNVIAAATLEQVLLAHGITQDKTVVLYGRNRFAATRTALVLLYAGVKDVRLLDGGVKGWTASGFELETDSQETHPAKAFGVRIPAHPEFIISTDRAQALSTDKNAVLVCVRSWEEYIGVNSGYDYVRRKGRIPGSVWAGLPGNDQAHRDHYQNVDSFLRDPREIAALWKEKGITPDRKIAFYCGTGWRASEAFFYAYLMGWKDICVYDGGWLEWSAQPDRLIEVGKPGEIMS